MSAALLIVDDDRTIRESLVTLFVESGYRAIGAEGVTAARQVLARGGVDALLLDIRLKDGDGLAFLAELRAAQPRLPVIMATSYSDSDRAIAAMRQGAFEYVTKPFDLPTLLAAVERAVRSPSPTPPSKDASVDSAFVGSSAKMLTVWKAIGRAAASDAPVLITGESGVGKELVARAIHDHSDRKLSPFIAVNIAALPPALVESELFGHERGAFTGAAARREGRFELAAQGTLFLDEIGDLDLGLQTKLLRVLEGGTFERVGGQNTLTTQARIVAATSRPVQPKSSGTTLREDLFYRLGVVRIEVPPLRERRSDIPLLVEAFLRRRTPRRAVSESGMQRLMSYDWPGNVRELRHMLENACVMSAAEVLDEPDFMLPEDDSGRTLAVESSDLDLRRNLEKIERSLITQALTRTRGNRAEAARLLGIRRALLYTRIKELQLHLEGD